MVIVMRPDATEEQIKNIEKFLANLNLGIHVSIGSERTIIGIIGDKRLLADKPLEIMPGVDRIVPIVESFKLVGRTFKPDSSVIEINGVKIGGKNLAMIAGPCAVESYNQLLEIAKYLKSKGVHLLRGGAYKPRTSPYSFQGLREEGLRLLAEIGKKLDMSIVSEVVSLESLEKAAQFVDVFQIGARNMQNFELLKEIGKSKIPVILKRGLSSTIEEWLNAAEYIATEGNYNIILCERGIRTFETYTRNTLDLSSVPIIKELSHLPVIVDPSHGTGKWNLVMPMSRAAVAAGADGLMIEVHPNPQCALSDGPQSLNFNTFDKLMDEIRKITTILEREL